MPRPKRVCPAGEVFHILNRAVARLTIFEKPEDYDAFLRARRVSLAVPVFLGCSSYLPLLIDDDCR